MTVSDENKSFFQTFMDDDLPKIKSYIWEEMIKPAFKKTVSDVVHNGASALSTSIEGAADIALNHETKRKYADGRDYGQSGGKASTYQSSYKGSTTAVRDEGYKKVYFRSRQECENILMDLDQRIQDYGKVTLNEYYELAGVSGSAADEAYGWVNLRTARPENTINGWTCRFPTPINLK